MQWLDVVLPKGVGWSLFVRPLLLCLPEVVLVLLFWPSPEALTWSCLENLINGCLLLLPMALSRAQSSVTDTGLLLTVVLVVEVCGVCFLLVERRQWWWHVLVGAVFSALYTGVCLVSLQAGSSVLSKGRVLAALPSLG
jgi:hypothetical protein